MKIIVLANMPHRIQAQTDLCQRLTRIDDKLDFYFILPSINDRIKYEKELAPFKTIIFDNNKHENDPLKRKKKGLKDYIKPWLRWVRSTTIIELFKTVKIYGMLRKQGQWMAYRFNEINPRLAISNGDRHGGFEPPFLKQALKNNIPVIVPYLTYSGSDGPLKTQIGNKLVDRSWKSPLITHLIFIFMKNQFYKNKYLFYSPSTLLALKIFGTLSKNPWQMGCGLITKILVDGKHTYNRYLENGVEKGRLSIVGDISYDTIFLSYKAKDQLKKNIIKKYQLNENEKIIIGALPQLFEHNLADEDTHWKEIEFLVKALSERKCNILLSLHPKMDKQKYLYLENKFNVKVIDESLNQILPVADLFLATFSSTIIWAVLCGIPSIVVDFYDFGYDMYDFLKSVKITNEKKELAHLIEETLDSVINYSDDWKILSRENIFNGETVNKVYELLSDEMYG